MGTRHDPQAEARVGTVLASKYRLEQWLGSGAMGDVYRAVNVLVGREVAIKRLREEHASEPFIVDRFLREARAANLVRHPNVVDVVDVGQDEAGAPFLVQELLHGQDLSDFARGRGGRLSFEEISSLVCPVIDAVAEAHARGVVHRDIKPANVFLSDVGGARVPKLLDFGISKIRATDVRATEVGVMMGTPAYMSPEQVQGAREADARSDVWALGVMLFELLSGRLPFQEKDAPALFYALATKDAPSLASVEPSVPASLSRVVERCLRRRPDERYPSAAELARDLRKALDGDEIEPTQKRSAPPKRADEVPDLVVPAAPPAPTLLSARPRPPPEATVVERSAPAAVPAVVPAVVSATADVAPPAPALAPAPAPAPAPSPPEAPPFVPELDAPRPPREAGGRLLTQARLDGVMLAPGPSAASRAPTRAAWGLNRTRDKGDSTSLVGAGVLGLATLVVLGALMQLAHRPDGWPAARFLLAPSPLVNAAIQGGLALLAGGVGVHYARRGMRHWRGEIAGGLPNVLLAGLLAAVAFFCAIELICAAL